MAGLPAVVCPTCQRPVKDPDASFCAGCGAPLPPTTVDLDTRPAPPAPPAAAAPPKLPGPPPEPPAPTPIRIDNRPAAYAALVGAVLGAIGAFQVWLRITVFDPTAVVFVNPPGGAETGWKGGDGRTIVVAAVVAAIAGIGLLLGRRDLWLKVALLIAGGVTLVIALVHMANVGSKASDIEQQFGIPTGDVRADVGAGLYIVIAGGVAVLAAGLRARTASS